ncbi:transglutaminase-like domain-containing protein [Propionicicella superfundia]|uniref:transglutaminase-like domain-containing protein n=1 Tax=Propionicicella superfundia TaxID=348582 RepID=UPI00042024B5|nr:transglutaminase family protein [Propionicicella superfundia]
MVNLLAQCGDLEAYLGGSAVIDLDHAEVRSAHAAIVRDIRDPVALARSIYLFVRDEIRHSLDAGDTTVTLIASEVLRHRTGLCYAKSHLAAALYRLSGIPTGLCYQLVRSESRLVLHGLVAVHLDGGWHRLDVRGNKPGVNAEFDLRQEELAFHLDASLGETDLPDLFSKPAPAIIQVLRSSDDIQQIELPCRLG